MHCTSCNNGDLVEATKSVTTDKDGRTAVVLAVPVTRCTACGRTSYTREVAIRLDDLFNGLLAGNGELSSVHYTAREPHPV